MKDVKGATSEEIRMIKAIQRSDVNIRGSLAVSHWDFALLSTNHTISLHPKAYEC